MIDNDIKYQIDCLKDGKLEPGVCQYCIQDDKRIYPTIKRIEKGIHVGMWEVACRRCRTGAISEKLIDAVIGWNAPLSVETV